MSNQSLSHTPVLTVSLSSKRSGGRPTGAEFPDAMAAWSQAATFPFDQVREIFQGEMCHANLHLAWSVHVDYLAEHPTVCLFQDQPFFGIFIFPLS
jgi:hypothetical protein